MFFSKLFVSSRVCVEEGQEGNLLKCNRLQEIDFQNAGKRDLYQKC